MEDSCCITNNYVLFSRKSYNIAGYFYPSIPDIFFLNKSFYFDNLACFMNPASIPRLCSLFILFYVVLSFLYQILTTGFMLIAC